MEPTGVERHGQSPEGVSERGERANQSKSTSTHFTKSLIRAALKKLRSRRESNPHLRFRKPLFCPLNYGNRKIQKRIHGLNGVEQVAHRESQLFPEPAALL